MSDVIRLNDHRDGFAPPVVAEFLRTGLLPPNLCDEMLRSMDEQEAECRQVLREAIEYLRTRHNDELCIQGVFAEICEEMFGDTNFPSAVHQRMMLFRERLLDQYRFGAPYVLERDELRFLADNLKRLCDFVPPDEGAEA
jgi:hypothetical protein